MIEGDTYLSVALARVRAANQTLLNTKKKTTCKNARVSHECNCDLCATCTDMTATAYGHGNSNNEG